MATGKAIGRRGDWFARVRGEDEELPCVHKAWMEGRRYDDPHVVRGDPIWERFIEAIQTKRRVILTDSVPLTSEKFGFKRTGYIAVFEVTDVEVEETHLRFVFAKRLMNLQ